MRGKYPNPVMFHLARLKRAPMVSSLRGLVSWEPMASPEDGYTVVIGCMAALPDVAVANLNLMQRMTIPSAREVVLVFDRPADQMPGGLAERIDEARGSMPVKLLHYSDRQHAVAERFKWGWVYAWMSWTIGIANSSTRHVLLHDLDAMPVNPDFFEQRYQLAKESGKAFFGIRWYKGNGIDPEDKLATTFEMVLDAQRLRAETNPIDGFNTIRKYDGRGVDFDTFLNSQTIIGSSGQSPIDEGDMVHPSQLICQYTDLMAGRNTTPMPRTNLPLMPAYMHIGGRSGPMNEISEHLERVGDARLPFMDRVLDVSKLTAQHWVWLDREARRLAEAATGAVGDELQRYLKLMGQRVEANGI